MTEIIVNLEEFLKRFIYFRDKGITSEDLENAYINASNFISTKLNTINLPEQMQVNGVYLACAHDLYLQLNPNLLGGSIINTGQGSEDIGFQQKPIKNWSDYYLSLTTFGMQLLAILQNVQPPRVNKKANIYPYYNTIAGGYYGNPNKLK